MRVTAEGGGVASGCGEGFWSAYAQVPGGGIVGVSRCPSSFDWPPQGASIPQALRDELVARDQGDLGAITDLDEDQLGGMTGIVATVTLDPAEARRFGISGEANGVILRGATSSDVTDPRRPDIYEVFCLSSLGDPEQLGPGCDVIIASFELD
jgi:hypothetical protein